MNNDRKITISTAGNRRAVTWAKQTLWWSELVDKLKTPARGAEPLIEYLRFPKSKQDDLKDVGGFVAGELQGSRRKANAVIGRDVLTLDMDNITAGGTQDALRRIEALGCGYCVYSTRKHEESKPRLRVLLPLSRTATADEYEPLARKLAVIIGIEMCDPSTFEASRLMYWPSCCADSTYIYVYGDKPLLDADGVLDLYANWRNVAEWPEVPGIQPQPKLSSKQTDPTTKSGVVGAFCKTYDVYRAMEIFLPDKYIPCDIADRYTFTGGSTTGGAVVYDNGAFLFSHHATDPAGGKLCNSFDLVRYHLFADKDDEAKADTPTNKLPSYTAMCELAVADKGVSAVLNTERYEKATEAFSTPPDEDDTNWLNKLAISPTSGQPAKTTDNILIILEKDPLLKDKLAYDEFANRGLVLGSLPWDSRSDRRQWTDIDDAGLRHYIEKVYNITGKDRIYDAAALAAHKHTINDVRDYLTGLEWDGTKRLDTLLIDYLGAEDNIYTRAVMRKSLTAAVARIMVPGVKYDYMPIFAGPQGIGKSTLLKLLGRRWYSDSLQTFDGKDASEMIQGTWINELGELNGMSKSEINSVKQFLSRTDDIYREPYGRRTGTYPRRCVFFGTTNDAEFLRDRTGNRRFWPVDVWQHKPIKNIFTEFESEVYQIWAEAFVRWQLGEPLYLSGDAEKISRQEQETHQESNAKEGIIREFIDRPIPLDWDKRNLQQRRMYWSGDYEHGSAEGIERTKVCAVEVWCECFGGDPKYMRQTDAREINSILESLKGWTKCSTGRFGPYGTQRGFLKVVNTCL